ncbi:Small heat shock protein HSP [Trema orientale]|uniref:Small heat shock protein HSP n=1 Tax=Trema orientale TaxID=63057 RepID=A0A2P5F7E3_TREOI|nr:Small heat shock protein HSP [Trema orientale]
MANVRGARGVIGDGSSTSRQRNAVMEEIIPSSDWTEDLNGHYLLVDLPDFKKEQVKIQVINSGHIKIYGERPVNENKFIHFKQSFKVPENSDMDAITAKFDGEILYITVPKKVVEEKREPASTAARDTDQSLHQKPDPTNGEKEKGDVVNGKESKDQVSQSKDKEDKHNSGPMSFSTDNIRRWESEAGYVRSAMELLSKNKAAVVTAMLAFSLGMLISRKFESDGE